MKLTAFAFLLIGLVACGGGGGGSSDSGLIPVANNANACTIITSQIQLSNGQSCELTETQANQFSLSAGTVECANGIVTFGNSQFQSGTDGVLLNGLTFFCN